MSADELNSEALTIKLNGHASYRAHYGSSVSYLIFYSFEWEEYARTGDIESVVQEHNLSPSVYSSAKNVLNRALLMLIKKTTTDAAHEFVIKFCKDAPAFLNAERLLDALFAKYSVVTVHSDAGYYFKIPTLIKASSVKEKLQWVNDLADLVFSLPKYSAVISEEVPVETLGTTGITELKEELDEVRENFAAHMLLALCPDVNTNVLNFVGRQRTITTSEVMEHVERNTSLTPINTTSSFPTVATATETAMLDSKPRTKRFNSRKPRTCYVCGQKHILSQRPTLKGLVPNAPVFNSNGNKSKNEAWFGYQDHTSDSTVHGSSELSCVATESPLSKENWVFDSGCTTHVCCDRSMFSTFMPTESSTVSGIAGNAPILGYNRVELENITLMDVAYIPSMTFNLISIRRASVNTNLRFIFAHDCLSVVHPSGKVKQVGTVKNGLYVLDRPDMWHQGELSYAGSEVSFNTCNTVYDPLLPQPKNSLSTQVKFDESVFPLEGSYQTIDSHEFATSTLKGVSRYPDAGATMSVPSKAIPYSADISVSGPDEPASGHVGFPESFDFSPVSSSSSTSSNRSTFQDVPTSPPPTRSFSSLLQDDNMEDDTRENDDL